MIEDVIEEEKPRVVANSERSRFGGKRPRRQRESWVEWQLGRGL